jgi:curved DNA-binding protein CbpA
MRIDRSGLTSRRWLENLLQHGAIKLDLTKDIAKTEARNEMKQVEALQKQAVSSSLHAAGDRFLDDIPGLERYFTEDKYFPKNGVVTRGKQNQTYSKFKSVMSTHKKWAKFNVDAGYPTFYSIMCVTPKDVDVARMEDVSKLKQERSYIPKEVIDEAYRTLKNPTERTEYYRFLLIFQEAFIDLFPEKERAEILHEHAKIQLQEKRNVACAVILKRHANWGVLYDVGVNLLAIARIKETHDIRAVVRLKNKYAKDPSETGRLRASICTFFSNPVYLHEYQAFLILYPEVSLNPELREQILALQKKFLKASFDSIDLSLFLKDKPISPMLKNWQDIKNKHSDWARFLPPNKDNFYLVLGIEKTGQIDRKDKFEEDGSNFRTRLFEKFKILPKTVEVNQAYTVLRSPAEKEAYDFMLTHHLEMQRMDALLDRCDDVIRKSGNIATNDPFEKLFKDMARDPLFKKIYNDLSNYPGFTKFFNDLVAGRPLNSKDPILKDLLDVMSAEKNGYR